MKLSNKKADDLKAMLDHYHDLFNCPSFIENDPIQIPHRFTHTDDIAIAAFLTSSLAWGKRAGIIKSADRLMGLMDNAPHDFVTGASARSFRKFESFVHRTFNGGDCAYFVRALAYIYKEHGGLKTIFESSYAQSGSVQQTLVEFREIFFEKDHALRVEKHISDAARGSAAKRLNMFLMWMVRRDEQNVHFGIWNGIPMSALYIPLDIHCGNIARHLGMLHRKQNDWKAVEELTDVLRTFNADDPVRYDFALFGMGVNHVPLPVCRNKL